MTAAKVEPLTESQLVGLTVVEGIESIWSYHLRAAGKHAALCGNERVMPTEASVSTWGVSGHLHERYCKPCEEIAKRKDAGKEPTT